MRAIVTVDFHVKLFMIADYVPCSCNIEAVLVVVYTQK